VHRTQTRLIFFLERSDRKLRSVGHVKNLPWTTAP
jgi:hypothetical protein